ncbi:MAG: hypothetical protein ACYTEX_10965 [Planctomycetota bacterium]|jgi:hypothetical protein
MTLSDERLRELHLQAVTTMAGAANPEWWLSFARTVAAEAVEESAKAIEQADPRNWPEYSPPGTLGGLVKAAEIVRGLIGNEVDDGE